MDYTIQYRNGQYTITLPKAIVEGLKWGKKTKIKAEIGGKDKIMLIKC